MDYKSIELDEEGRKENEIYGTLPHKLSMHTQSNDIYYSTLYIYLNKVEVRGTREGDWSEDLDIGQINHSEIKEGSFMDWYTVN